MKALSASALVLVGMALCLFACPTTTNNLRGSGESSQGVEIRKREMPKLRKMLREGKQYEAIKRYRALSRENPDRAVYAYLYGLALKDLNKKWKAFDQCLRRRPQHYWCLVGRGKVYTRWRVWDRARKDFLAARSVRPEGLETIAGLAGIAFQKKKLDEAKKLYQKVLAKDPKNFSALWGMAQIAERKKDRVQAIQWYEKAASLQQKNFTAYRTLGRLYAENKQPLKAIENYRKALKIRPKHFRVHMSLAELYEGQNELGAALALYNKAADLPQAYFKTYYRQAVLREKKSDYSSAIKALRRALRLNRGHFGANLLLARLLTKTNKIDKAIDAYWRCVRLKSDEAQPRLELAALLRQKQKLADALRQYKRILSTDPKNQKAKEARRKILHDLGLSERKYTGRTVRGVLRKAEKTVIGCYKRRLRTRKKLRGRVNVSIIVNDGEVENVGWKKNTLNDPVVQTCIKWTFEHAHFPKIKGRVLLRYSLRFTP